MTSEKQDEEYLETLLNSIVNGDEEKNLSEEEETPAESSEQDRESNQNEKESEQEDDEEDFDKWQEDEIKKEDLSNEIDVEKVLDDENNDIGEIINSMYSDVEDSMPDNGDIHSGTESNLTDIDNLINHDISSNGKNKEKKDSFFKKLFSEKEKTSGKEDELNEEKILSETGSTAEDMSKLGLKNDKNLFD